MRNLRNKCRQSKQVGSALLEGLFAILIFSMGILGLVGLQISAVKQSTDAKYRAEASLLANELIGRMWATDRIQANLKSKYETGGEQYNAWKTRVSSVLPGITDSANQPQVNVSDESVITVTLNWQAPGEDSAHNYVLVAQVK